MRSKYLNDLFKNDQTFEKEKKKLLLLFLSFDEDNLDFLPLDEQILLSNILILLAIQKKWSRRKFYFLMHQICIEQSSNLSIGIYDFITNYLDVLGDGRSWPENVVHLFKDTDDKIKLSEYVNSNRWVYNEYYIEE
jgi:hypothetical protein